MMRTGELKAYAPTKDFLEIPMTKIILRFRRVPIFRFKKNSKVIDTTRANQKKSPGLLPTLKFLMRLSSSKTTITNKA
jgi:hypothetical protein